MLAENLQQVNANIEKACAAVSRDPGEVTLVAVSKTKPVSMLQEAYDAGARVFGENKVQELCDKFEHIKSPVHWHMIGHLQTNKVKYLVDKVCLIHSVDSLKLARQISKEAEKKQVECDVLIEVNVAQEESKFGITTDETLALIREVAVLPHVHIKGLMTIAPFVDDPEENRPVFRSLYELSKTVAKEQIPDVSMEILSMGMTNDYMVAIEEGATMVRVGTGIFGERNYNI